VTVPSRRSTLIAAAVAAAVVAIVGGIVVSLWGAVGTAEISLAGWLAMAFGVLATLALGVGLMALVFISSRRGYDELDRDRR
jgi:ABC-type multidrug transport system permease subunit